jgi:hypothetical protein
MRAIEADGTCGGGGAEQCVPHVGCGITGTLRGGMAVSSGRVKTRHLDDLACPPQAPKKLNINNYYEFT